MIMPAHAVLAVPALVRGVATAASAARGAATAGKAGGGGAQLAGAVLRQGAIGQAVGSISSIGGTSIGSRPTPEPTQANQQARNLLSGAQFA